MRIVTYIETTDDYIYISIMKGGIEHKYKLFRNKPSFSRLVKLIEYYSLNGAYMRIYPNDVFSIYLDGYPYGKN